MYRSLTVSAGKTSRQQAASTSPLRLKTVSELARVHSHQPSKENPLAFELGTVNELLSLWEALSDRLKLPLSCPVLNVVGSLRVTDERLPTIVKEVREESRLSLHVYRTVAQLIK
jgi:RNAse (barnase) inhibitor barstar